MATAGQNIPSQPPYSNIERVFQAPQTSFFLFGPRGTGKSTWLRARFPGALWIDLLEPTTLRRFFSRPERLHELIAGQAAYPETVVIDEVQKAPPLLDVVHSILESPRRPRFVLTGSSARKLKQVGVDLLAGRALLRNLHPFLASELDTRFHLETALHTGLVPLVFSAPDPSDSLATYVGLYLKEEVQQEGLVRSLGDFARFLEAISFSHAALLNLSEVARECEVSRKTAEGYLSVLEDLLLGFRLPVFSKRARRHLTQHPKFFFFDTGVFRRLRPAGPLDRAEEIGGAALEGLVAQHLRAWLDYKSGPVSLGLADRLYHWRTKSGTEVDFVLYGDDGFQAIEVKSSATVRQQDLRGLKAFREDYPEATCILLYRGNERLEIDGISCRPVEPFLRALHPAQAFPS